MKYILNIPEPCHEDWNKMTVTEKGKHCMVCEKEVIDFTKLSNYQIVKRIENKENVCGRFKKNQLNTPLRSNEVNKISRAGILLSFTALFAITTPVFSHGEPTKVEKTTSSKVFVSILKDKNKIKEKLIIVKGIVSDEIGPVADIIVKLKDTQLNTITDFDGEFELVLTESQFKNGVLEFNRIEYQKNKVVLKNENEKIQVVMKEEGIALGGVSMTGRVIVKRNIFQRMGDFFRKKK